MKTMTTIAITLILSLPFTAIAQSDDIPKSVLENLSKDLSQLQEAVLEAQNKLEANEALASNGYTGITQITVTKATAIRSGATDKAASLFKASKGQTFDVLDKAGVWYAVGIPESTHGIKAGWIKAAEVVPHVSNLIGPSNVGQKDGSLRALIFRELTERAMKFKQSYENNPYISVTGFTVNVLPPSLSINFEFKK